MANDDNGKAPEPFFHLDDNFSSAYFGNVPNEGGEAKNPANNRRLVTDFIDVLTTPAKRDLRVDALEVVRKAKAQQFLVDLIGMEEYAQYRQQLVMACWESGLDFSMHLIFFAELVVNCEYPVAIEALTVIDEMHDLSDGLIVKNAIEILKSPTLSPEKQELTSSTLQNLEKFSA